MAPETIIRILPLQALFATISREGARWGRYPTRIIACPTQVSRWKDDLAKDRYAPVLVPGGFPTTLSIMGIPVTEGAPDCQPELIWASPIHEAA